MNTDLKQAEGTPCLRLSGELNIYTVGALKNSLLTAMARNSGLAVDVSAVTSIDGAGLQVLALAARELQGSGRTLRLIGDCPPLNRLVDLLAMRPYFGGMRAEMSAEADPVAVL